MILRYLFTALLILSTPSCASSPEPEVIRVEKALRIPATNLKADENILLFPTNARLDSESKQWQLHIHGWVFEPEADSVWRNGTVYTLRQALGVEKSTPEAERFTARTAMFLVDNEAEKNIVMKIGNHYFAAPTTKSNGHFEFTVNLDSAQTSCLGWLPTMALTPATDQRTFTGNIQCITNKGISVISDIDDTIKQSNVLDKKQLLRNTFLKEFTAVPGMAELYRTWQAEGAAFHYVSSSPWQLYPSFTDFFGRSGFPRGSMHLKLFRIKDSSFFDLFDSPEEGKIPIIRKLLEAYPQRQFILVGDSGEKDPEIYASIAQRYPNQIKRIYIHDVTNIQARLERVFKDLQPSRWLVFKDAKQVLPHYLQRDE